MKSRVIIRGSLTSYQLRFSLTRILISTLEPDSSTSTRFARLVYRLRLSNPCFGSTTKGLNAMHSSLLLYMCRERGSNPHGLSGQGILSPSCLPIPPSRHRFVSVRPLGLEPRTNRLRGECSTS